MRTLNSNTLIEPFWQLLTVLELYSMSLTNDWYSMTNDSKNKTSGSEVAAVFDNANHF